MKTKTSKMILGAVLGAVVLSSAHAVDTAKLKAACQKSKTKVWVEQSQACIPENPCKNDKYSAYCGGQLTSVRNLFNPVAGYQLNEYDALDATIEIMNFAVKEKFGWTETCNKSSVHYDGCKNGLATCNPFISCTFGEKYLAFSLPDGDRMLQGGSIGLNLKEAAIIEGKCDILGGQSSQLTDSSVSHLICDSIDETKCNKLNGKYMSFSSQDSEWKQCVLATKND